MLVLCMLLLSAQCYEILLERAELSSTKGGYMAPDRAIDGDMDTQADTTNEADPWWRVYFDTPALVHRVVVEKGRGKKTDFEYSVAVFYGDVKTKLCGSYNSPRDFENYFNKVLQCGGKNILIYSNLFK